MPYVIETAPPKAVETALNFVTHSRPPSDDKLIGVMFSPLPVYGLRAKHRNTLKTLEGNRRSWKVFIEFDNGVGITSVSGRRAMQFSSFHITNLDFPAATGRFHGKIQDYLSRQSDDTIQLRLVQMPWIHLSAIWLHGSEDRFYVFFPNFSGEKVKKADVEMSEDEFFDLIAKREEDSRRAWAGVYPPKRRYIWTPIAEKWRSLRSYIYWYRR